MSRAASPARSATAMIRRAWAALSPLPGGRRVFSKLLGRMVPYTGTIDARVAELAPGRCRVGLSDHRAVRNHLDCIHAIALVNLGEVATGLATLMAAGDDVRGILTGVSAEYVKKARGDLTAECRVDVPAALTGRVTVEALAEVRDAAGDVVARVTARWTLQPA